jgi:hypothetical protein
MEEFWIYDFARLAVRRNSILARQGFWNEEIIGQ